MSELMETAVEIFREAVEKAGGLRKAATQIGVSHAALSNWINQKRGGQVDIFLTALEKLGARIVPKNGGLEVENIHRKAEIARAEQDKRTIDVLTGQIEILQRIIYGMNAKQEADTLPERKKDAG